MLVELLVKGRRFGLLLTGGLLFLFPALLPLLKTIAECSVSVTVRMATKR